MGICKMRAICLIALVLLPAAVAYTSASKVAPAKASSAASSSAAAPAQKTIQVVKATLKLPGVSAAAFNPNTAEGQKLRTAFKNSVALGLKICGTSGTSQCSGTDVVITDVSRRRGDATVSFYVKTASKTAASSGATALSNYVSQGTTFVDNLKQEAAHKELLLQLQTCRNPSSQSHLKQTPSQCQRQRQPSAVQARLQWQQVSRWHLLVCPCFGKQKEP